MIDSTGPLTIHSIIFLPLSYHLAVIWCTESQVPEERMMLIVSLDLLEEMQQVSMDLMASLPATFQFQAQVVAEERVVQVLRVPFHFQCLLLDGGAALLYLGGNWAPQIFSTKTRFVQKDQEESFASLLHSCAPPPLATSRAHQFSNRRKMSSSWRRRQCPPY